MQPLRAAFVAAALMVVVPCVCGTSQFPVSKLLREGSLISLTVLRCPPNLDNPDCGGGGTGGVGGGIGGGDGGKGGGAGAIGGGEGP